jgi:hypothetical protein
VLCYRFYDIAESIDLDHARVTLQKSSARLKLKREGSQYLQMMNPPLGVEMGTRELEGRPVEVQARLFEQGAVAVMARVPMSPGMTLEALVPFSDALYDSPALDALGKAVAEELRDALKPALKDPHIWEQSESYTVVYVREFEDLVTGAALLADESIPRLLVGETKEKLSSDESKVVMEHVYRYGEHDLAVVDWNATFLYDPTGTSDLADVIEIANAQLLELRYYDDVLDRELTRVYDAIENRKPGFFLISPWKGLLRELMRTVIELSELIERVENALKIIGDVFLARVYEGALVQLRIKQWQATVTRKHGLLKQTYELLRGEVDTGRSLTLETMIVLLIIFEIAMTMLKLGGH